jgi:hypothetical protein
MAISVSKDTSFSTGSISFSALRLKFKKVSSGQLRLSELKRQTSTSLTNPVVPNATENENIPTTNSNIQISDYRGSISYYNLTQTGVNTNLDIDTQTWNGNLGKNIVKEFAINGTIGATSTSNPAATLDATIYNLSIRVNGSVQGAGGAGGTLSSPNGKNGGPALYVRSTGSAVNLYGTSKIYAGGGGGGFGAKGGTGGQGGCVVGLAGGVGGAGGNGGNGGNGQGYNQTRTNGSDGAGGAGGAAGQSTTYLDRNRNTITYSTGTGGTGGTGGKGGDGGDWGASGTNGKTGSGGHQGASTDSAMSYYANWNDSISVTFGVYRDAVYNNRIYFGNTLPYFSKGGNGSKTVTITVSGGVYAPIWGEDIQPRTIKGILILNRTNNRYPIKGNTVSLDDSGNDAGFDYTDLEVTPNQGILYSSFSVAGSSGLSSSGQGSGGSSGNRITGSNYTVRS